jgi:hypothetical protein
MGATDPTSLFGDPRIDRMLHEGFEEPDHACLVRGMAGEQLSARHDRHADPLSGLEPPGTAQVIDEGVRVDQDAIAQGRLG